MLLFPQIPVMITQPKFIHLVAEWIHFTLLGDYMLHYKFKTVYFWGASELSN